MPSQGLRDANTPVRALCQINSGGTPAVQVPFGGYKQSGFGKEMGEYALHEYVMPQFSVDRV